MTHTAKTSATFGPDRPRAAMVAIAELEAAQTAADTWCGFGPASVYRRLRAARENRARYAEYGDTFRGH